MAIVNTPEEGVPSAVTTPDDSTPEAYRGKSPQELIEMHQNAERKLGQMSEEVGSLRRIAEQLESAPRDQGALGGGDSDVDFYTDPETFVRREAEKAIRPLLEKEDERAAEAVKQKLTAEHPDWQNTVKETAFQEWVAKSKVRTNLFIEADRSANYDAASELFSTWAELQGTKADASNIERKAVDRDRKLRAATTESKGSGGIDSRKILNRVDLISLRQNNPSRYNELLPDIRKAYQEGRVR